VEVTVLTPTYDGRDQAKLGRAVRSVAEQTVAANHLVRWDTSRDGPGPMCNRLLEEVDTPWVCRLDDDDWLHPHHLETLLARSDGNSVVYSSCEVLGANLPAVNRAFDADDLEVENFIPCTALVATEAIREVGGWPETYAEDYGLWLLLSRADHRFEWVPDVTWVYDLTGTKHRSMRRPANAGAHARRVTR